MEKDLMLKLAYAALVAAVPDVQYVVSGPAKLPVHECAVREDGIPFVDIEWEYEGFPRDTYTLGALEKLVDVSALNPDSEEGAYTHYLLFRGLSGKPGERRNAVVYVETSGGNYCDDNYDMGAQVSVYFPQGTPLADKLIAELKAQIAVDFGKMIVPSVNSVKELIDLGPARRWDLKGLLALAEDVHGRG